MQHYHGCIDLKNEKFKFVVKYGRYMTEALLSLTIGMTQYVVHLEWSFLWCVLIIFFVFDHKHKANLCV